MPGKKQAKWVLEQLNEIYPEAATLLNYNNLFELLVAVILSAQSTDEQVNRVTPALFARFPDAQAMAEADIADLENLIKGVGLFRNKARHLRKMSQVLSDDYQGQVPNGFDQLLELPGVGRKTANVVLAVGFNGPGLGVDTHVHRVANRLGLVNTQNRNRTEQELKHIIPKENWNKAHHLLIWHGRQVCKARQPKCDQCLVQEKCRYYKTDQQ